MSEEDGPGIAPLILDYEKLQIFATRGEVVNLISTLTQSLIAVTSAEILLSQGNPKEALEHVNAAREFLTLLSKEVRDYVGKPVDSTDAR